MSIKNMLMTEAAVLTYSSGKSRKYATQDDVWMIPVDGKTIGVKATTLRVTAANTSLAAYKASSQPTVFNLIEIMDDGKVSKVIKMIPKPLNVIATIAEIIANETKENKRNDVVMIRLPSAMGAPKSIVSIIDRYIKKNSVPFIQYGTINAGDKGSNYIFMTRVGKTPTVGSVFGIQDADIKNIHLNELEMNPEVSDRIVTKLEPQIKKAMPTMIKLSQVVGGEAVDERARDFLKENPPVLNDIDMSTVKEFDVKKIFSDYGVDENSVFLKSDNPVMDKTAGISGVVMEELTNRTIADSVEAKEIADRIKDLGITMTDFAKRTSKLTQLVDLIGEATADEKVINDIVGSVFAYAIVSPVGTTIASAYQSYRPRFKPSEQAIIEHYCGSSYTGMNNVMLHGSDDGHYIDLVKRFDEVFKTAAVKVSPELTVFRGSRLAGNEVVQIGVGKLFHFRTFVSTSINPTVGFRFGGNDKDQVGRILGDLFRKTDTQGVEFEYNNATCAFMINGLDKIPVIIPGATSPFPSECEVILPRGTTIRINELSVASEKKKSVMTHAVMDCTVVAPNEVSINEAVYDGDEFLATGRLVEFTSFVERDAELTEAKKREDKASEKMNTANMFINVVNSKQFKETLSDRERREFQRIADKYCGKVM